MRRLAMVLSVVVAVVACKKPDAPEPPPAPSPVSDAEAEAWAVRAETAFNTCDKPALDELVDLDAAFQIAMKDQVNSRAMQRGVRDGARKGAAKLIEQFCEAKGDGRYKKMKVRQQDGESRALIRLVASDGANYIDWVVGKQGDAGKVRAHDAYIYATGQRLTETLAELIGAVMKSSGGGSDMATSFQLARVQRLMAAGQHQEAMTALDQVDPAIRNSRGARFMRLQLSAGVSDEAYAKAIAEFEGHYPGDAALDFVSIDGYLMRKDYTRALASIERLEKRVGSDGYLRTMAATTLELAGKRAEALAALDKALALEPDYADATLMRDQLKADVPAP